MQIKSRLSRALLCVIFAIALFAGIGTKHSMSGAIAVLVIHLLFAVLPDNMCCLDDGKCIKTPHHSCVVDDIAVVVSVSGMLMAIINLMLTDSTEPVVTFCATFVLISTGCGVPVPPPQPPPDNVFADDDDA